ncbi:MAG: hypothetical protein COB93_06530 [Sneathiella sp.]|nr:MAG: hypothetical protein COB93_06530 [Sneathiella sp.]
MTTQQPRPGRQLLAPHSLCDIISRLSAILEAENILLEENRPQAFSDSLSEKTRLVAIYNQQMTLIKQDPEKYKRFPKADIEKLKAASETFYATLDVHFRKLSTVKTVTEGLVKSVADEVMRKKAPPSAYTASASLSNPLSRRNAQTINGAIAINQIV